MKKKALIFGITGQDNAYLSKFSSKKNYIVYVIKRKKLDLSLVKCKGWKFKTNFFKVLNFTVQDYQNFQK